MSVFSNESTWRWSDLLGYAADNTLRLVIELKPRLQTGALGSAGRWLHEIGQERPELYALFVTPAFLALRLPAGQRRKTPRFIAFRFDATQEQLADRLSIELDYGIDAPTCLDAAIDTKRVPLHKLEHNALEQVVSSWLSSSLLASEAELLAQPSQAWLVESGLHTILHAGAVVVPNGPHAYASAG